MKIAGARSVRLVGGALALASCVGVAGCRQLAERLNPHETVPAPGAANGPSPPSSSAESGQPSSQGSQPSPSEPAPPPALQPGGAVTPKTEAPSEARVLSSAFSAVARALRPSVVRIDVEIAASHAGQNGGGEEDEDSRMAPFLRRFFGPGMPEPEPGPQRGTGSGVVMDARGDIVTNRHVVSGATNVKVTFSDGREFTAKTLGMDSETDVAVIRLDAPPRDLVAARLGDDDKLEVGEWVLAVGSPLGLDQTVTAGIISGKGKVGRHVQMSGGRVRHYIQTDAKINPGNSGGPLVNLSSEVVGINTLINTGPGGAYGFAIPINQVRRVAESLLKEGRVRYAYLGVLVGDLSEMEPAAAKAAPSGTSAFVSEVTPGGPAAKAGLHPGDFITDIDGKKMDGAGDVIDYVSTRGIGAHVAVGVWREGKRQTVDVVLGELPSQDGRSGGPSAKVGLALQTLTPRLAESLGLDPRTRGAVVAEVAAGGQAAAAGVREGDVILEIDRQRVTTSDEAVAVLGAPRKGGHLVRLATAGGLRYITLGGP
ncbi:MAG TPA: trypsin-like peptidase domain-containing protein [Polyangia bacterium]|nr:trypsin-like peptidase domain-containing protein [Polyangia bacterium]